MCLIVLSWQPESDMPLALVAHRDEFRARPTKAMHIWAKPDWQHDELLAGKDQLAGGTWLAFSRLGSFAALTNVRTGEGRRSGSTRGFWPVRALTEQHSPFCRELTQAAQQTAPFNLLWGNPAKLFAVHVGPAPGPWLSTEPSMPAVNALAPGVHALSNAALNTPWPKVRLARERLQATIAGDFPTLDQLCQVLRSDTEAEDHALPDTGVGLVWERRLSPMLIKGPEYGTRSVTAARWLRYGQGQHRVEVMEQTLDSDGVVVARQHFLIRDQQFTSHEPA